MKQVKLLENLIKPLIVSGIYKDEGSALKAIIVDYIDKKITEYDAIIRNFRAKYKRDFDEFSKGLTNNAGMEVEDDWMEWKGAIEMKNSWIEAYQLSIHGKAA
ncbi:MAG: hypothetical protein MUF15_11260 [Acidobacteria bacterium]|jgi:hypothetical protein|nr:hypothetical protein [Acidobacteriota bacterium]